MIRRDFDPAPRPQRARFYWVVTWDGSAENSHKVAAYDATDAAVQAEYLTTAPGESLVRVEPFAEPGLEQEWGGRNEVAAMLGVHANTAGDTLAYLEVNYGLGYIGENTGKRWNLAEVRAALLKMAHTEEGART